MSSCSNIAAFKLELLPFIKVVFISFNESPLKMMKNIFPFMLKTLFVLKIFKFLYWLFGYVEKRFDKKANANFKIYDVTVIPTKIIIHIYFLITHEIKTTRQRNFVNEWNITWQIFFLKNYTQNVMEKLVPDTLTKK